MPFHCKILGAGGGKQWSQLNIEKAKGRVDFRKGRERGAQIEPSLSSSGHCGKEYVYNLSLNSSWRYCELR